MSMFLSSLNPCLLTECFRSTNYIIFYVLRLQICCGNTHFSQSNFFILVNNHNFYLESDLHLWPPQQLSSLRCHFSLQWLGDLILGFALCSWAHSKDGVIYLHGNHICVSPRKDKLCYLYSNACFAKAKIYNLNNISSLGRNLFLKYTNLIFVPIFLKKVKCLSQCKHLLGSMYISL